MKRPVTGYSFWTEHDPDKGRWTTYATRRDDEDGEPVGDDHYGDTPEASLAACGAAIIEYDDRLCEHAVHPYWCAICNKEEDEG